MPTKELIWWQVDRPSTPPLGKVARRRAGFLLRLLQLGELPLKEPHVKRMRDLGRGVYELRIPDAGDRWRLIFRIDDDAIVVVEVFKKKTGKTPNRYKNAARQRLRLYDNAIAGDDSGDDL